MVYLTIRNIEKYHPNYKDRNLIWCKTYFTMLNADPDFEMLDEIDKWRFIAFTMLQIQTHNPIPLDEKYLSRKGFDFKKKKLADSIISLANFTQIVEDNSVTELTKQCNTTLESVCPREEKSRVEEEKSRHDFETLWNKYPKKLGKHDAHKHFQSQVKTDEDYSNINKAINNFLISDVVAGDQKFIPHGSTWFNERWRDWVDIANATGKSQALIDLERMTNGKR